MTTPAKPVAEYDALTQPVEQSEAQTESALFAGLQAKL